MQPRWMAEAWREFGAKEYGGKASNPRIAKMFADAGHPHIKSDEVAWCAAFVGASLKRANINPSGSLMARSYLEWGRMPSHVRLGTIAVFTRGPSPHTGHVGFWIGETNTQIVVLGGNQANAVSVTWIDKTKLLGLRWPITTPPASGNDTFFRDALAHIFDVEGDYTEDPYDPGGPTNLGITLAVYARYKGVKVTADTVGILKRELEALTRDVARKIYRDKYWFASHAPDLPRAIALMHFDAAVNQGVGTAARMLQQAVDVAIDGEIGPITRRRVWQADRAALLQRYADIRRTRYRRLKLFWRFGRGWLNRVEKTLSRAQAYLAEEVVVPNPVNNSGADDMKNSTQAPKPSPNVKWWGQSLTIWGSIVTGLSTVLPVLAPLIGLNLTAELVMTLGDNLLRAGQAVGGLLGTIMVILGRTRATQRLTTRSFTLRM